MSGNEVNPWIGLLPSPKKISPFSIPEKSAILEGNRKHFTKKVQIRPNNMNPIVLPNSSKFPPPQWQEKK